LERKRERKKEESRERRYEIEIDEKIIIIVSIAYLCSTDCVIVNTKQACPVGSRVALHG
jgi:hypothetical protein